MSKQTILMACIAAFCLGCTSGQQPADDSNANQPSDQKVSQLDINGIENVYRLSPRIVTGGKPASEAGFAALKELGVKKIVSVTDDAPDVETARKYGLEYVHVPLDYEGVSPAQSKKILSAFADGESQPVYIHCNSGRNRGATAAGICLIGIEGKSNDQAISWMKTRGVDEANPKMYDSVRAFQRENIQD